MRNDKKSEFLKTLKRDRVEEEHDENCVGQEKVLVYFTLEFTSNKEVKILRVPLLWKLVLYYNQWCHSQMFGLGFLSFHQFVPKSP